jgi:hypothetical protein
LGFFCMFIIYILQFVSRSKISALQTPVPNKFNVSKIRNIKYELNQKIVIQCMQTTANGQKITEKLPYKEICPTRSTYVIAESSSQLAVEMEIKTSLKINF